MARSTNWYRVTVSDTAFPSGAARITEALTSRLQAVVDQGLENVAVFASRDPWVTGDFYFSPAAARILSDLVEQSGGVTCEIPLPGGLDPLFGPEGCWEDMLGGRSDLTVQRRDELERKFRKLRSEIRKLAPLPGDAENSPRLKEFQEEEERLQNEFKNPHSEGA